MVSGQEYYDWYASFHIVRGSFSKRDKGDNQGREYEIEAIHSIETQLWVVGFDSAKQSSSYYKLQEKQFRRPPSREGMIDVKLSFQGRTKGFKRKFFHYCWK